MSCEHCHVDSLVRLRLLAATPPDADRWLRLETRLLAHLAGADWVVARLQEPEHSFSLTADGSGRLSIQSVDEALSPKDSSRGAALALAAGRLQWSPPTPDVKELATDPRWPDLERHLDVSVFGGAGAHALPRWARLARKAMRDPALFMADTGFGPARSLGRWWSRKRDG